MHSNLNWGANCGGQRLGKESISATAREPCSETWRGKRDMHGGPCDTMHGSVLLGHGPRGHGLLTDCVQRRHPRGLHCSLGQRRARDAVLYTGCGNRMCARRRI